jgi:hypothetical protein
MWYLKSHLIERWLLSDKQAGGVCTKDTLNKVMIHVQDGVEKNDRRPYHGTQNVHFKIY